MASQSEGTIRLFVLGEARIETPKGVIEPKAERVFAAALFLILKRHGSLIRRELQSLLWPSAPTAKASHRFRQTLLKVKQAGIPVASSSKSNLLLQKSVVTTDYEDFLSRECTSELPALRLLPGYNPQFSEPFLEWLDSKKGEISASITRRVVPAIQRCRERGDWLSLEAYASALRELNPYNEEAVLALAEAHAMRGDKIEGVRILDSYIHETGTRRDDLGFQAALLRRRIANQAGASSNESRPVPFVGRGDIMTEIGRQLGETRAHRGQSCLILGEAGIGKSRMASEVASFGRLQGVAVLRVQCRASHKHRPLSVFVQLVPSLRSMRGAIGCSPQTLSDLDRLTQHRPLKDTPSSNDNDPHWLYGRIRAALYDILDAVADECPLLIQIEDAHWLDNTSSEVLAEMTEWGKEHSVLFLLTGRQPPEQWIDEMPAPMRIVSLPPLDRFSSAELFAAICDLHSQAVDSNYLDWCVRVAEGNPYFIVELATHWVESGAQHEVPPSLSAVLKSRVDRLEADALQVLQTCALLENNASMQRLEQVLEYAPHRLLSSINSLGTAGMIVTESHDTDPQPSWRLASKHELLSNVALQRLTSPARAFLHRRIGLALEQEIDDHFSTALLWDCAKHWQLAGDSHRAFSLALSCAGHLMKVGLSKAAAEAYDRCIPFCSTDRQRLDVLEGAAAAHYSLSDWEKVRATTALARMVKERVIPEESSHDDLELMDLRAQWQTLQWTDIGLQALRCLEAKEASARHRVEGGIMAMMLLGFRCNAEELTVAFRDVTSLISEHDLGAIPMAQAEMVFHTGYGDLDVAVRAARALISEQRERGNVSELFRAYCNSGVTLRVAGLLGEAEQNLRKALELAERFSLELSMIRVLPMLANIALEQGNIGAARDWYGKLKQLPIHSSDRFGTLEFGGVGARLALVDGDGDEALRRWPMTRAEAHADNIYHRKTYNCALQIAIDLCRTGSPNPDTLRCLIDAYEHSKTGLHQAFSVGVIHAALIRSGNRPGAEKLLHDYCVRFRREAWPVPTHLIQSALTLGANISPREAVH